MVFWGALVKYDEPLTVVVDATTPYTRLRFSQAVLDSPRTLLPSNDRHFLCCQVGEKPPIAVCSLRAVESEVGRLDLEFKHPEIIVLTIKGAQDIFVSGYYFEDYHPTIMPQIFSASNREEEVAASKFKLLLEPPTQNEPHIASGGQHLIVSTSNPKKAKEKEVMQSREHVEENVCPRIQVVTSGEKLALETSLKDYAQEAPIEQGVAHVHEIASTSKSNKAKEKEVEQFIELVEENAGPRVQVLTNEEKHALESSLKDYAEDAAIEQGVAYVQEIASCYISNKAESVDLLKLDNSVEVHVENTVASQVVTTGEIFCLESSLQDYAQVTTQDASAEHVVAHVQEPASSSRPNDDYNACFEIVDKSPAVGMDVEDEQSKDIVQRNASPMSTDKFTGNVVQLSQELAESTSAPEQDLICFDGHNEVQNHDVNVAMVERNQEFDIQSYEATNIIKFVVSDIEAGVEAVSIKFSDHQEILHDQTQVESHRDDSQLVDEGRPKPRRKKKSTDRYSSIGLTGTSKKASQSNKPIDAVEPVKGVDRFILLKRPQTALTTARVEKTQLTSSMTEENKWAVVAGLCAIPKSKEVRKKRKQMENEQINVDVQSADANDEKNRSHYNARDSKEVKKLKPEVVQNVAIQLEANNDETTSCKENVFLPPPILCLSNARDEEVPQKKKKKKMMEKHMQVQSIDTDNENKRSNCDVHDSKEIQKKAKVIQDSTMQLEVNNDETFSDVHDSKEIQKKKKTKVIQDSTMQLEVNNDETFSDVHDSKEIQKKKAKVIQDSTMQLEVNNDETVSDVHDSKEIQKKKKKKKKKAKVIQDFTMQLEVNNDETVSDVHDSKEIQKKKKAKVIQDSKM